MADKTPAEIASDALAFEERELGVVVDSAHAIRVKFEAQRQKLEAAETLIAEHTERRDAAAARLAALTRPSSTSQIGGHAPDATVSIREN